MIKILDFATTSQGAYRLLRKRVAEIQQESEFEDFIVCPPGEEVELLRTEGLEVIEINIGRSLNPFALPGEIKAFQQILQEAAPDVVHSHNSKAGGVARLAVKRHNRKKTNKPIVIMHQVHGFVFGRYRGIKRSIFVLIEKILAKSTDFLLFQNELELQFAQKAGFNSKAELVKIGNGISFEELDSHRNKLTAQKPEGVDYRIVCVARLEPVKNQMMLLHALRVLKTEYNLNSFVCTFIGEGDPETYKNFINSAGLSAQVEFTGKVSRDAVVGYYESADLNVLTSLTEGMPRALMEAIYLGVPSIGTNVIGTSEVIKPGVSGELVELGDVESLAEMMATLLRNQERREALVESGKAYALVHFDERNVIKKLTDLYIRTQK